MSRARRITQNVMSGGVIALMLAGIAWLATVVAMLSPGIGLTFRGALLTAALTTLISYSLGQLAIRAQARRQARECDEAGCNG